jgi:hypothetical protein
MGMMEAAYQVIGSIDPYLLLAAGLVILICALLVLGIEHLARLDRYWPW